MPEENNKIPEEEENASSDTESSSKKEKKKSLVDTIREVNERERREELEQEARAAEQRAEREREQRDAYARKLAQDRLELMKLKAGVISEEEIPKEEKVEKVYTAREKISNFFYHNKITLIFSAFLVALAVFLIYDLASKVEPDVSLIIIAKDDEFYALTENVRTALEPYCSDYNGDGKVSIRVSYLPAVSNSEEKTGVELYYSQADQTKLVAEFQAGDTIMVIADRYTCEQMDMTSGVFADIRELYPDTQGVDELGYMLSATSFSEDIKYSAMADDLFMSFRKPTAGFGINEEKFKQNYANALDLWNNYLTGNIVNVVPEETTK